MKKTTLALAFSFFMASLTAGQGMSLRSAFSITGAPGKPLQNPTAFFYDAYRERLLVANTGANAVDLFTAGGEFLFRIGETGGLSVPIGASALSSGQIVILQEKSTVLKIYDEAAQQLDTFNLTAVDSSSKIRISRIFADGKDNLYFLDAANRQVLVLDKSWQRKMRVGASGRGKLRQPFDLAVDNAGKLYLTDESDCPIRVFDPKGRFLFCLERQLPAKDRYWRPAGICADSKGRIWALDAGAAAIRVYDPNGNWLQSMDSADNDAYKFFFPVQITVDRYGKLYLLEKGKNAIEVFQIENY